MMLAITAAGPAEAYTTDGYQHFPLRTFLTPLEQTARLCHMTFPAPYVLHSSLKAQGDGGIGPHAEGYGRLLTAIRDDAYDFEAAMSKTIVTHDDLPVKGA
jgi:putative NADPH-quinone reductase